MLCLRKTEISLTNNKVEQTVEQATDTKEVGKEVWDERDNIKYEGERYYKTQSRNQKQKQRRL